MCFCSKCCKALYPNARVNVPTLCLSRGSPFVLVLPCQLNVVMPGDAGVAVLSQLLFYMVFCTNVRVTVVTGLDLSKRSMSLGWYDCGACLSSDCANFDICVLALPNPLIDLEMGLGVSMKLCHGRCKLSNSCLCQWNGSPCQNRCVPDGMLLLA